MPLIAPEWIESNRLLIRLVKRTDLPALFEVNSSAEVTALLPYATWQSMADAEAWFSRMEGFQSTGLALQFVVIDQDAARPIGTCLLFRYEEGSARAELGYVLGRPFWGKGLMREGLAALISCAFGPMNLRRIEAEVDTRNQRSSRLLNGLGFTREGVLRERWVAKGELKDVEIHGLLSREWRPTL